ncbi:MAG: hypothetical protein ACKO0M_14605 [Cyanobium sp.]
MPFPMLSTAALGPLNPAGLQGDPVQIVSLLGALLQLVVYALLQLGRLASASYPYQLANVSGSLLMTIVATINREYGFILMEGVWFLTSAYGLLRLIRQRGSRRSPAHRQPTPNIPRPETNRS